jgi:transposase
VHRGPRKIRREQDAILLARLEEAPDATVLEHCAWWAEHQGQLVSEATMWRALHRLGWTHKESHWQPASATRRREAVAKLDPEQLVFVDESGTHTSLTRLYGWAPHDQRATGSVPRNHGKNTTLVAALTPDGLQAPWTLEGAMDTAAFEQYVKEVLGPTLRPGQMVVLDNLSVYKAESIREAIEALGCALLFLLPYSPDCTPIEQAFSKVKALQRGLGARVRDALLEAIRQAVDAITRDDAIACFANAGYALPAQGS